MSEPLQITPAVARGRMKEELWDDPNWIAEEKLDGVRYLWHIHEGHSHFTSRRISAKTGLFVQKDEHFPHLQKLSTKLPPGTILDGEMTSPIRGKSYIVSSITNSSPSTAIWRQESEGWLKFMAFDVLYCPTDVRQVPYYDRRRSLRYIVETLLCSEYVNYPLHAEVNSQKRVLLDEILQLGGEGIIFKHINAPYGDPLAWVKVKPVETYEVVIIGYKPANELSTKVGGELTPTKFSEKGWIGALTMGRFNPTTRMYERVGYCSGMDEETREKVSNGMGALNLSYMGKVIEVCAQEKLPSGALRHPRFVRFRDDKNPEDCTMED